MGDGEGQQVSSSIAATIVVSEFGCNAMSSKEQPGEHVAASILARCTVMYSRRVTSTGLVPLVPRVEVPC